MYACVSATVAHCVKGERVICRSVLHLALVAGAVAGTAAVHTRNHVPTRETERVFAAGIM